MNNSFAKLNLLNSRLFDDIRRFVGEIDYVADFFGNDDSRNSDKWDHPHFNYVINSYGFRGDAIPTKSDLAAFGCSFTFGSGLPEHMLWHNMLSKKLNTSCINFGQPSCSIESIVDIFLIASKHVTIKKAIFLLPNIDRLQIAKKLPDSNLVKYFNIMSSYSSVSNEFYEIYSDQIYRALPEEEIYKICKNQLYLLDYIAKERGIQVYISSWEPKTYNFIKQLNLESIILPLWESPSLEFAKSDLARDLKHPGYKHHELFANKIIDYIK
jgi:hypothetical protein